MTRIKYRKTDNKPFFSQHKIITELWRLIEDSDAFYRVPPLIFYFHMFYWRSHYVIFFTVCSFRRKTPLRVFRERVENPIDGVFCASGSVCEWMFFKLSSFFGLLTGNGKRWEKRLKNDCEWKMLVFMLFFSI